MSLLGVFGSSVCDTIAVEYALEYLAHEVFPWIIGCTGFVYLLRVFYLFRRKIPTFGLSQWLVSIPIYIGTAFDVLACYASLLRINFSYLGLAIFPLIAISFIGVMCMRHSQLIGRHTDNGKKKKMARNSKGKKTTVMLEKFNIVALLAPHFILYISGMVGDPDHDGNNYDISNFCLFLTCMLQDLTVMMTRLPATISRGIAPASELLCKSSLVVLLFTAHMMAVNSFGEKVVVLLLPEVVPPLLWFSLHLDRRTPIINVQNIVGSEHFIFKAVIVAMCGCILQVVHKDEALLYWASTSCATSGIITYIIVLVLRLWPEKASFATLSFEEVLELLTFWGKLLLQVAIGLFAFGSADLVYHLLV